MMAAALLATMAVTAQTHNIVVDAKKAGAPIQPTMYGLFFEDINYAADGGLYGELVKNRSFEFPQHFMGWQTFGSVELKNDGPFERCPHYVTLRDPGHAHRRSGLINEGYFGIGLKQGEEYRFSVWAKSPHAKGEIRVQFIDAYTSAEDQKFANEHIKVTSADWQKYEVVLRSDRTINRARLRIFLTGSEEVSLEHISLFPVNTFKGRRNGLRADIAQALADVHPGLLRFPGGCIVEGTDMASRYQWKNSIGPVENRPLNENRWEFTFESRFYPDYFQSYGLGFFEFFQLAEDIGASPLPVLNVGMACQFQCSGNDAHVPVDELQPYIDDCLDLIEFANGPADSEWGSKRVAMGHPEPFNLKYIGVGNEQWDSVYYVRLKPFVKAIRERYPDIQIVGTSGPDSEGEMFEKGWMAMKDIKADLVDEHFYRPEKWFLNSGLRYDNYDRKGPKVFAGEYACHGASGKKWNHYEASILEAALMTGMERNADVVWMTAYAPLLAHVEGWQWRPDLIWFDNNNVVRTVSYYVQQMYATHKGTNVLKLTMDGKPVAGQPGQDGLFASAVVDKDSNRIIVKVVNTSDAIQNISVELRGLKGDHKASTITLCCAEKDVENTIARPNAIVPVNGTAQCIASGKNSVLTDALAPLSFRLYCIEM